MLFFVGAAAITISRDTLEFFFDYCGSTRNDSLAKCVLSFYRKSNYATEVSRYLVK